MAKRLTNLELSQRLALANQEIANLRDRLSVAEGKVVLLEAAGAKPASSKRAILLECQRIAKELGATTRLNTKSQIEVFRAGRWVLAAEIYA
jgi:hypothetical protein